jgi:hypothetical protein
MLYCFLENGGVERLILLTDLKAKQLPKILIILSRESWIDLFALGILSSERISFDLKRSRYFLEEQREE